MGSPNDKCTAVVVLPAAGAGRIADKRLRYWLARSDLVRTPLGAPLLPEILVELGREAPATGLAALRMWGQTGDRPTAWMAAADPVYLEPRLDHLCLHALDGQLGPGELRRLVDHLQLTLGGRPGYGFAQVGDLAYVTAEGPIATAAVPAAAIDGERPDTHLPESNAAEHRRLVSEIEMALHEHAVNLEREARGRAPVNGLWLWGGGTAPDTAVEPIPPLFADDPLLQGYWRSRTGVCETWGGNIARCLDDAVAGFVAVVPDVDDGALLASLLQELRAALGQGRLERLVLRFRDGLRAEVTRVHGTRFWRLRNTLLETGPAAP